MTQSAHPTDGTAAETADAALGFCETMATRLCHDMAGMLGTVMGALELARSDPDLAAEAWPVAQDGAQQLGQRLRLLRSAWGGTGSSQGAEQASVGMRDIVDLCAGLPSGRRVQVVLDELPLERQFTASAARLLLNLLLLGVESLHGAGVLTASGALTGDIMVTITGPRVAWPPGFAAMLADSAAAERQLAAPNAHNHLQAPLTALLAHRAKIRVAMLLARQTEPAPPLLISLD